jgi:hypothetical protein
MTTYRHTQTGRTLFYPMVAIASVSGLIAVSVPAARLAFLIAILVLGVAAIFRKLTIKIDDVYVRAIFGPGLTLRKIKLCEIAACEPIRIRWWYGWGIHPTPYGLLYNVSGWDAVALTLRNGRRVSLGTDQPNELCAAIRRLASAR